MRYIQLDFLRGVAIVLMQIFHISFDLNNFNFIDIDIYNGSFWHYFRYLILTLFLLCVGISLSLANQNSISLAKALKRFWILLFFALCITIVTRFIFESSWIYFGVIHFIAVASLLALLFVRLLWTNLFLGVAIIVLSALKIIDMHWLYNFLEPSLGLPKYTEDLVQFFPWFGVVLMGIFFGNKKLYLFALPTNSFTLAIAYLGKHSLAIYMLHQPLFFGLIAGASYLLH